MKFLILQHAEPTRVWICETASQRMLKTRELLELAPGDSTPEFRQLQRTGRYVSPGDPAIDWVEAEEIFLPSGVFLCPTK